MLRVQGVEVRFDGYFALNAIDLEVGPGEVLSIVGPNGAGKSTLLRVMDMLIKPKVGSVYLDGKEISSLGRGELAKRIGYVPQRLGFTEIRVFDFVLAGRKPFIRGFPRRADFEKAHKVLRDLRIEALAQRPLATLSGGEFQRVMIAKALVTDPKVLLLDEPTSNLDPHFQKEILDMVYDLSQREGLSVVMVLHDLTQAYRYSHKVVMLHGGRIFAAGRPEEVLTPENIREVYGVSAKVLEDLRAIVLLS